MTWDFQHSENSVIGCESQMRFKKSLLKVVNQNFVWEFCILLEKLTHFSFRGLSKSSQQKKLDAFAAMVSDSYIWCFFSNILYFYRVIWTWDIKLCSICFKMAITVKDTSLVYWLYYIYFVYQMVLERYFSTSGQGTELVLPKNLELQAKLQRGPPKDVDFFSDED